MPNIAVIRPEAMTLTDTDSTGPVDGMLKGRVTFQAYVGVANEYSIDWHGQELFCVVSAYLPAYTPGTEVIFPLIR